VDNQISFLLRGGIDLPKWVIGKLDFSKFIFGVEFNYIPKADVSSSGGQKLGTVSSSNVALSIGHMINSKRS